MNRVVISPLEERPALRNGIYHHDSFKKRHRIQSMDIGGRVFAGALLLVGVLVAVCIVVGAAWLTFALAEAVLRRFV